MLSVYTPALRFPTAPLPVLVYIHGGGLVSGGMSYEEQNTEIQIHSNNFSDCCNSPEN